MDDRFPISAAVGAVVYSSACRPEVLLAGFAKEVAARGFRIGGLVPDTSSTGGKAGMTVREADSGRRLDLSQRLGPGSRSCSLDLGTLAEVSGALRRGIAAGVDVLFANKFSAQEAGGGGLAAEMLAAMAEGVPLLTAVKAEHVDHWLRFTGGRGQVLAPTSEALWRWWGPERLYDDLILGVGDGAVRRVVVGPQWVMVQGPDATGLAYRPERAEGSADAFQQGGTLRDLAQLLRSWDPLAAAVGAAACNAHYNRPDLAADPVSGFDVLDCAPAALVVVGGFPEIGRRLPGAKVVDHHPLPGQFPAEAAQWLVPGAEGVLVTASALVNRSLPGLLRLAAADSQVVVVGPSAPLTPRLFDYGVASLSGLVVTDPDGLAQAVTGPANGRDLKRFGRLATLKRPVS